MDSSIAHDIWLADLVRAWHRCGARTASERQLIASLLGFTERHTKEATTQASANAPAEKPPEPALRNIEDTVEPPQDRAEDAPIRLVVVATRRAPERREVDDIPGPALPLETEAHLRFRATPDPLFDPQYQREILFALGATVAAEGEILIDAAIARIARGLPLMHVERTRVLTVRRGVQLLLDRGDGMSLFFEDQRILLDAMRGIIGVERVQLLHFANCPTRGAGAGPRYAWRSYTAPPPRTKVIIVSDFGITQVRGLHRVAEAEEWAKFADTLRAAECELIGLVPYPPHRWPGALLNTIRLVQWDRPTRFSSVRRTEGQALRANGATL